MIHFKVYYDLAVIIIEIKKVSKIKAIASSRFASNPLVIQNTISRWSSNIMTHMIPLMSTLLAVLLGNILSCILLFNSFFRVLSAVCFTL